MTDPKQRIVRRRQVFYVPGYDPFPPRRYRELYRKESAQQAQISGYQVEVAAAPGDGGAQWTATGRMDGVETLAQIHVLGWSDLVRQSMGQSIPATYGQLLRTAWTYLQTGALWRLMRLRKGPLIAALYPVVMLLGQLALAVALAGLVWRVLGAVLLPGSWGILGLFAGLAAGWGLMLWFRSIDGRTFAYYLMHDYAYSSAFRGADPPDLEHRIAAFADQVADSVRSDVDEVLVVGHSSGAHVGARVLARLIRTGRVPADGPSLSFLSLGQVIPMISFLPEANGLRADLHLISGSDALTWIDVSAPGDGCSFALCDPVAVSGVAPEDKRWPLVISAAFTQTLKPETWRTLRWRFFRLHFQYLCAFDAPGDYDYFRITAGPLTLPQRFAGRAPSRSRKEVAVNKYTARAAA